MTLPDSLKELQDLCEQLNVKFKVKTKAQLKELIKKAGDVEHPPTNEMMKYPIQQLKEFCEAK